MSIQSDYSEVEGNKILIDFNVTSIDSKNIYIQMNFTNPTVISKFTVIHYLFQDQDDVLMIEFSETIFIGYDSKLTNEANFTQQLSIPQ